MEILGTGMDIPSGLNSQIGHYVCIFDPASNYMALYINGTLALQRTGSTPALSSVKKNWPFLGRSLWSADPYLNADIKEFRIYDGRLSPEQIADNHAAGPDVVYLPSSFYWANLTFEWPTYPGGYAARHCLP